MSTVDQNTEAAALVLSTITDHVRVLEVKNKHALHVALDRGITHSTDSTTNDTRAECAESEHV